MNKSNDTANIVVNEQLNRMLERERKNLELLPMPELGQECPFLSKDQMFEVLLHAAVMIRISMVARSN